MGGRQQGKLATAVAITVIVGFVPVAPMVAAQHQSSLSAAAPAALEPGEDQPGGEATARIGVTSSDAFSQFSANMPFARELDFKVGNGLFRKLWVSAPSSTRGSDGLGPLFNARACQSCHLKDGRGHPPLTQDDRSVSLFLRLSVPPSTDGERQLLADGRALIVGEPTYGGQLQELAVPGHAAEGRMMISYTEQQVTLAGGEVVRLRQPSYRIADLGYGPLHPETMISPRLTPQMIGLGLLEAIPEADIRAREDPDDRDGDGISGRANHVWSLEHGRVMLGRFGWKAGQPSVLQQSAEAFAGDIGIASYLVRQPYGDCTPAQTLCRSAPHGGTPARPDEEVPAKLMDLVGFYARNLAVPPRRDPSRPDVLAGKALFSAVGCATCHTPSHVTGDASPDPHLRGQRIWPYTDLLLHDMGPGLADGRPEGRASGSEWRTPPLWGIGLTGLVNGHAFFLHDGRARSITEAILGHGGEAQRARDAFASLTKSDRDRLLAFVNSL